MNLRVAIRPACGQDAESLEQLLPAASGGEGERVALVAAAGAGDLLGAALLRPATSKQGQPTGAFWLHVAPRFRRQGLGTALWNRLVHEARLRGVVRLFAPESVRDNEPGVPFAASVGLAADEWLTYQMTPPACLARTDPMMPRLRQYVARVEALSALPQDQLLAMAEEEFAEDPLQSRRRLQEGYYSPTMSFGIADEGQLVGFTLARHNAESTFIDRMVVRPDRRRGALAVSMCRVLAERSHALGLQAILYSLDPRCHRFSLDVARSVNGQIVRRHFCYSLDLLPAHPPEAREADGMLPSTVAAH